VPLEVQVEDVTPGAVAAGARLELGQVDVGPGKALEGRKQPTGLVAHAEDNTGLVRFISAWPLVAGDYEEAGVVEVEVFDSLGQHLQAVNVGGSPRGYRRQTRFGVIGQLLGRAGGVVDRHRLQVVAGDEAVALGKGLRVTYYLTNLLQARSFGGQQVVAHPQVSLADDVQVGLEQEVVGLIYAAGDSIFYWHHAAGGLTGGYRLEHLMKGGQPHRLAARCYGDSRFFAERAGGALVCDLLAHRHQYTDTMIRFLEGVVIESGDDRALISLHGLGFEVFCPVSTLGRLRQGETARLHTRLVVREDSLTLYGFHDPKLLEWFDLLTAVSGVGPRVALGLLSTMPLDLLGQAVSGDDAKLLTAAPGVGKKLAERIVLELKNKLPEHLAGFGGAAEPLDNPAAGEAAAALVTLGFRESQVHAVVQKLAAKKPEATAEELIRLALRELR